jgi:dTDP-4-amino-4,6-dideoxygalactose transaminase
MAVKKSPKKTSPSKPAAPPKSVKPTWPAWPMYDAAERKAVLEVLESGQWWFGPKAREFEEKFAAFQGAKYGVVANSGSMALAAALLGMGIQAGDEVILPPYTFMASASATVMVNAVPVFADILPDTLCIDPDDVERKITPRTRVIMPVHLAGYVADMDRLRAIAKKHKLMILEDACHAWGSQWRGKGTGALGDCGAFSFQFSKNITSAEGGIVLTDDEKLADAVRSRTNCGRTKNSAWYQHDVLGTNWRLTEFQAAILLAQLPRLKQQTLKRQANAKILDKGLSGVPGIITMKGDRRMTRRSYHLYVFRIDEAALGMSRQQFIQLLNQEGVPAGAGYTLPLYQYGFFKSVRDMTPSLAPYVAQHVDYSRTFCPVCEQVCRDTIWFGQSVLLGTPATMRQIVKAVRKVCSLAK